MRTMLLITLLLLAACSRPAELATVPPSPLPTSTAQLPGPPVPTNPPPTPAPPTPVVVTAPPGATALPASLLILERGQISRIAADGLTRTRLTDEKTQFEGLLPITTFDRSPANGDLVYIVGDLEADRLVRSDGEGRNGRILFSEPQIELSELFFSPAGDQLALRLLNNREQPGDLPSGVYLLPADGSGPPRLLLADDPLDDPVNPSRALRRYAPLAFAPDGAHLLLRADSAFYDGCRAVILPLSAGSAPLELQPGEGLVASCRDIAWSRDGDEIFFLSEPADLSRGPGGLFRAAAADGRAQPLLPPFADGNYAIVRGPQQLPDGSLAALIGRSPVPPPVFRDLSEIPLTLSRLAADGDWQPLRRETLVPLLDVLWHPAGSGLLALGLDPAGSQTLTYLPVDGGPALALPVTGDNLSAMRWAVDAVRQ